MGQYYRIVVGEKDGMGFHVYDASKYIGENGEKGFDGGKLLEHSWTSSCAPQSVFRLLRMKPHRGAWVGDYAQDLLKGGMLLGTSSRVIEKGVRVPSHVEVWGNSEPELLIMENALPLDGQFLLNMEAKEFVDCNAYIRRASKYGSRILHPLPLLTAVDDTGDYPDCFPSGKSIGAWAWNLLSVADEPPKGFSELSVTFGLLDD